MQILMRIGRTRLKTSEDPDEDIPGLPSHLDTLLDQPYTSEASLAIDRWHNYVELEWSVPLE